MPGQIEPQLTTLDSLERKNGEILIDWTGVEWGVETTFVYNVAKKLEFVSQNKLNDFTVASPAFGNGKA